MWIYTSSTIKCLPFPIAGNIHIRNAGKNNIRMRKVGNTLFYIKFMDLYYYNFRFILLGLADVFSKVWGILCRNVFLGVFHFQRILI